jgi:cytochrome c oxidase assembly factor CtaG
MAVLSNPIVRAALFVVSLSAFYYTPLFSWATTDHIGHTLMIVQFLITGYLFVQALIGVDPLPYRATYPMRLLVLLARWRSMRFSRTSSSPAPDCCLPTGTGRWACLGAELNPPADRWRQPGASERF